MAIAYYTMKNSNGDVVGVLVRPRPEHFPTKESVTIHETTKANFSRTLKALTQ